MKNTAGVAMQSDPTVSDCLSLQPEPLAGFQLSTDLRSPWSTTLACTHFLTAKASNVIPNQTAVYSFVNGDGQVNLFDYVVIDQSFGARGE